jgi:xyloglucan-specific exo-beta-1,4-glucanase
LKGCRLLPVPGMYTNQWDPNNGRIYKSVDGGSTWTYVQLPFKVCHIMRCLARVHLNFLQVGGNSPGRGLGERLAVDPNLPSVLYFGARSGNGLWKCELSFQFMLITAFLSSTMGSHSLRSDLVQDQLHLAWCVFSWLFLILAS